MQLSLLWLLSFGILHVGIPAAHVHGEQPQPGREGFGLGDLELGDDHDGRRADADARILVGRALHPARRHQPQVRAVAHAVRGEGVVDGAGQRRAVESDVQRDRLGALGEPVEVLVGKAGWPSTTRRPSQTRRRARSRCRTPRPPLPRAASGSPLTQTRMSALRGSSWKSWMLCAIAACFAGAGNRGVGRRKAVAAAAAIR